MPYGVYLPGRWRSQPQGAVEVDWGHPLARRTAIQVVGQHFVSHLTRGAISISAGAAALGARSAGTGVAFSGGAQRATAGDAVAPPGVEDFTIEVLCQITAAPSLAGFFGFNGGSTSARALIAFSGANNRNIHVWANNRDAASGVDWRIDGSVQHVFATRVAGDVRFYRDGVEIAQNTTSNINSLSDGAPSTYLLGDMNVGWSSTPTGVIQKAAYYRRALSGAEIAALSDNPWAILRPRRPIIYSLPSSTPVLSAATVIDIGSTSVRPRVTITI